MRTLGRGKDFDEPRKHTSRDNPPSVAADCSGAICELVREMYQFNAVGGPLHIVLDDGNTDVESIRFCVATSRHHWSVTEDKENGPAIVDLTATLGYLLLRISKQERDRLYESRWGR